MWPLLFSWLLSATTTVPAGRPLMVSAAVSLTEALTACGAAYTRQTGQAVTFNFGASNVLARQIAHGAPVDVFVSADQRQMNLAIAAGAIVPDTVTPVVTNRLVVVVPGAGAPKWTDAAPLASATIRRIAAGDPLAVPGGVYAKQWLERIGLWLAVQPKIVPASSVRGALAAVNAGAADAGVMFRTDVEGSDRVSVVFEVTGPDAPAIVYPAGVVKQSHDAAGAGRFVRFLLEEEAQRILQRHGFGRAPVVATTSR